MVDRNVGFQLQQHRARISRQIRQAGAVDFFNILTGTELLEMTEAQLPEHRERLYPPTVALSMFMKQALEEDRSCQRAVNAWAAQRAAEGLSVQSIRTGAYCRARQRVPLEMISALTRASGRLLSTQAQRCWGWRGRAVKLADGTGISMADSEIAARVAIRIVDAQYRRAPQHLGHAEEHVEHVLALTAALARVITDIQHRREAKRRAADRVDVILRIGKRRAQRRVAAIEIACDADVGAEVLVVVFGGKAQAGGQRIESCERL